MNRIFHARIAVGQYLFLALIGILTLFLLWDMHAILAAICMVWLTISIEKLIHTTYTLTPDGKLILFFGRFSRSKVILLKDILSVERASSMRVGKFAVMRYVLVKHGTKEKCAVLLPVKEEEFIRLLEERIAAEV
ncbi:PH domain-containing protein [uncultured Bacteroides sp.]|uniref:PH domain-containing protein n=1 Tax=uncultured Bacteroides sp. TaxID=162156 RepID=UPI00261AE7FE|nr:PH domain-containing protein [uncultured Bacteroides sp.]